MPVRNETEYIILFTNSPRAFGKRLRFYRSLRTSSVDSWRSVSYDLWKQHSFGAKEKWFMKKYRIRETGVMLVDDSAGNIRQPNTGRIFTRTVLTELGLTLEEIKQEREEFYLVRNHGANDHADPKFFEVIEDAILFSNFFGGKIIKLVQEETK